MANTKYILEQIKVAGVLQDLLAKSDGENVTVTYDGASISLTAALAQILANLNSLPTSEAVQTKIDAAVQELINGAPETYDTLKEIADYIASHQSIVDALNDAIGCKVDRVEGKGLSAEDFTTALKTKLESLPEISAADTAAWNAKAETTTATSTANGLMSAADKTRLDGLRGVRFGTDVPSDLLDGELFIHIVNPA